MTDDEQCREVYAHTGLALYLAQVLEHAIVIAMVAARLPEREKLTRADIDVFMGKQFEKPLGRLISELRRYVLVPEPVATRLGEALERRNWIVHHYFRARAVEFTREEGRLTMIQELQAAQRLFEEADTRLTAIVRSMEAGYGITEETIAECERRLLQGEIDG